jgi:hypothetical protein
MSNILNHPARDSDDQIDALHEAQRTIQALEVQKEFLLSKCDMDKVQRIQELEEALRWAVGELQKSEAWTDDDVSTAPDTVMVTIRSVCANGN